MTGKCIVARVVGRHSHDGSGAVSCEYIIADPYRNLLACQRIDGIASCEYTRHFLLDLAFALGLVFHLIEICLHSLFLFGSGKRLDVSGFRSKHHECNSEDSVGSCSEYLKLNIFACNGETHLRTFRASDPVALCLFQ